MYRSITINTEREKICACVFVCSVECSDGVFRERSGVLSSVDFPSPYPKSSECSYRIEVEPGFRLRLQFDAHFDVEDHPDVSCPYDYVKVTQHTQSEVNNEIMLFRTFQY